MSDAGADAQTAAGPPVDPALVALLAPLAGASPVGRDLSYEAHFERLAAEVERGASLSGELPDWRLVETESARILREESKDLRAAAWHAAARAYNAGWPGAAEGLAAYHAVVEAFWEAMYPPAKRARARAALAGWLWESMAKALATRKATAADGPSVQRMEPLVLAVDASHAARLGDANPGAGVMRALVRQTLRDLPAAAPPPPPPPPPREEAMAAASSSGTEPAQREDARAAQPAPPPRAAVAMPGDAAAPLDVPAAASLEEAEAAADRWRSGLSTLARHAREASPASAWSYRLARVSAWLVIESAPDVENGKTFVRPPRPADRAALEALATDGAWEALRDAAEDALSEHIFWLDLHRLSALALERLGPAFAGARAAVGREVVSLLERVPSLASLSFSNATPFASPETVAWIADEKARFASLHGGGGAGAADGGPREDDGAAAITDAARVALAEGAREAALASALSAARALPTARGRFRARLGVAQLAATRGETDIALALFEQLVTEITPTLEAWEPALCAEALEGCLKALRAAHDPRHPNGRRDEEGEGDDERNVRAMAARERQTLLLRRLLSLDPAAALRSWG